MKIKTKKQLNLPQLIEWGWDNKIKDEIFTCEYEAREVYFDDISRFVSESYISNDTTFTVEVEEVVDENTKLPKSLVIFEHNGNLYSEMHDNKNINDILKMDIKVKSSSTKTIHMVNDDGTHTLIWRDGKLVE